MTVLALTPAHLDAVRRHGAEAYPEECCGVLVGRSGTAEARVERVEPVANRRSDRRGDRYVIDPEQVLALQRQARTEGLEVVGYYHSHPDHPARPSDFDREHAWPGVSYLIVGVAGGRPQEVRSWRLRPDRTAFEEENVRAAVVGETVAAAGKEPVR